MANSSHRNVLVLFLLIILVVGLGLLAFLSNITKREAPVVSSPVQAGPAVLEGTFECLPHKGDGPHTLECAFGFKADQGNYYALDTQNLGAEANSFITTPIGSHIRISGDVVPIEALSSDMWQQYNIVGIVRVTAWQRLDSSSEILDTSTWKTYRNEKYGVEFRHPADWEVVVTETYAPFINIYKTSDLATQTLPPFPWTHHTGTTHVSLFPQGVPTEGILGASRDRQIVTAAGIFPGRDFLLHDGSVWATMFGVPSSVSHNSEWNDAGFVFAGVRIENFNDVCVGAQGNILPQSSCELGLPVPGVEQGTHVYSGTINQVDRAIEEKIIESFRIL